MLSEGRGEGDGEESVVNVLDLVLDFSSFDTVVSGATHRIVIPENISSFLFTNSLIHSLTFGLYIQSCCYHLIETNTNIKR